MGREPGGTSEGWRSPDRLYAMSRDATKALQAATVASASMQSRELPMQTKGAPLVSAIVLETSHDRNHRLGRDMRRP